MSKGMQRDGIVSGYVWEPWLNRWQLRFFFNESAPRTMNRNTVLYNEFPFPVEIEYGGVSIGTAKRLTCNGVDISELTANLMNGAA